MSFVTIGLRPRRLGDYAPFVDADALGELRRKAEPFAGLKVLHISAGPFGGAVAETLAALVPLQLDLGILSHWMVVRDSDVSVGAALYEGLRGGEVIWGAKQRKSWHDSAANHAPGLPSGYDVVIVHEPQLTPLAERSPDRKTRWIWHSHLDLSSARPEVLSDLERTLHLFDQAGVISSGNSRTPINIPRWGIERAVIDPASPRNWPLTPALVAAVLEQDGIDPARPLIGHFAPIDQRYVPLATLGAYWLARMKIPGLQLAMVDPSLSAPKRAGQGLDEIHRQVAHDRDVHLLTHASGITPLEINALLCGSSAAIQLASPFGFPWGIAEAQWKNKPVIVGRSGHLPDHVDDGDRGFLVESTLDASEAAVDLINNVSLADRLGRQGHEYIRRHHLITSSLADYLDLFGRMALRPGASGGIERHPAMNPLVFDSLSGC